MNNSVDVASPCIRQCCLDDDDICLGCGRSLTEITRWSSAPPVEKQHIILRARERKALIRARWSSGNTNV